MSALDDARAELARKPEHRGVMSLSPILAALVAECEGLHQLYGLTIKAVEAERDAALAKAAR